MTSDENTSKVSHYLKVLLKQPGITKEEVEAQKS